LLTLKKIRPSASQYQSPILFTIKKPSGEYRMCVDYCALNKQIEGEFFTMPTLKQVFLHMHNKRFFSKVDLSSAYHQIRIAKGCEKYTSFSTLFGSYEYRVTPFGLGSAPAVFQRAMTKILFTLIGSEVVAYLDDILIATKTEQRNVLLCPQVKKLSLQAKFFCNKKKSSLPRAT
jgi:Reverse transcriptase (RNA-dependent DNA polymerase)